MKRRTKEGLKGAGIALLMILAAVVLAGLSVWIEVSYGPLVHAACAFIFGGGALIAGGYWLFASGVDE